MLRVGTILLILLLAVLALVFPKFRRMIWVALVVVLSGLAVIIWLDNRERSQHSTRISPQDIELQHMQVRPGVNAQSYIVSGRLRNPSPTNRIDAMLLRIFLEDCQDSRCDIVGEQDVRIVLPVPPSQSRDFQAAFRFSSTVAVHGRPRWNFHVVELQSDR